MSQPNGKFKHFDMESMSFVQPSFSIWGGGEHLGEHFVTNGNKDLFGLNFT